MKGIIFDIQTYAIYDGPGIRSIIFLKGCPLKCFWCHNPESQKLEPQLSYFRENCLLCGKCVEGCPNQALTINNNSVVRDDSKCTLCGTCVEICPNKVIEIIGEEKTIEEIVKIVEKDKPFYKNSGGGVTISGGEATMQGEFLIALLKSLQNAGIHTAIETCGYFNPKMLEKLKDCVDLFLYDIKHIDPSAHKEFTGVSNERILNNLKSLIKSIDTERVIVRIPIIPEVNTDLDVIQRISDYLKLINYSNSIHLMPYNRLAKTKYEKVGMGELYKDKGELSEDVLNSIKELFEKNGFVVLCNE